MNADGSGQANLTAHPGQDHEPSWSPDGQRIAFRTDRDGNDEIYTMTQGGALQIRLTTDSATDSEPAWSPDGSKILFRSSRDGNAEIYVMGTGGAAQTRLTTISQFDGHPDWQALVSGYPRPKGASPLRASLVPAYQECSAPTHVHGPPLGFASCNPPAQRSAHLTVGTPDANGSAATSVGSVRYAVHVGDAGPAGGLRHPAHVLPHRRAVPRCDQSPAPAAALSRLHGRGRGDHGHAGHRPEQRDRTGRRERGRHGDRLYARVRRALHGHRRRRRCDLRARARPRTRSLRA